MTDAHHFPGLRCPLCGQLCDGATSTDGTLDPPRMGDITICMHCSAILRFADGIHLKRLHESDMAELEPGEAATIRGARRMAIEFGVSRERHAATPLGVQFIGDKGSTRTSIYLDSANLAHIFRGLPIDLELEMKTRHIRIDVVESRDDVLAYIEKATDGGGKTLLVRLREENDVPLP